MMIAITRKDGGISFMQIIDPQAVLQDELAKWNAANNNAYSSHSPLPEGFIEAKATYAQKRSVFDARKNELVMTTMNLPLP